MNKLNCMVAQSGGPTTAINSSLAGVISAAMDSPLFENVYGSVNGIQGILNSRIINLTDVVKNTAGAINTLMKTPAMYLGSCRYKLPDFSDDAMPYKTIFKCFEEYNIGAFFYIGGNDSMDTVLKLSKYAESIHSDIKVIGIPKTIDNDLMLTDHTPGFGSAAKYIATSLLEIAHDTFIYAVKSVTIVEIMGRDAGWLTAASALARNEYNTAPHLIYLPETDFDTEQFVADVKELLTHRDNVIVAVSEGIHDARGNYVSASEASNDSFGHGQLSGAGKVLEQLVRDKIGVKVRSVEINILQRCAAHMASATDLDEAFKSGRKAVNIAESGKTGVMVVMKRLCDSPYTIDYDYAPIEKIANEAKDVPRLWINERGNDVTEDLVNYIRPLIIGEVMQEYKDGVPVYLHNSSLNKYL